MIVMKFGGSSVASPAAIKRVAAIVRSQAHLSPVVVVSALGDTTDVLSAILHHASHGEAYLAWKAIKELREDHFCIAEDLVDLKDFSQLDRDLREAFRDLHVSMAEVSEGERRVTPALRDQVLSLGEQVASKIVAAALRNLGIYSRHLDARSVILTDDHFTCATPRIWETYAKLRWAIGTSLERETVVLGGFIGATEQGEPTTLGRGGSDLTATLIGAALNAEEIQIWKDVDGMLTCDPRILQGGSLIPHLSYAEAEELAHGGAQILHPTCIAPAERLRIPVTLRNTFRPQGPGTRIDGKCHAQSGVVKSIASKTDVTLLEIRLLGNEPAACTSRLALETVLGPWVRSAVFLGISEGVAYLAVDETRDQNAAGQEEAQFGSDALEVRIRKQQTILTLAGDGVCTNYSLRQELSSLFAHHPVVLLPEIPGKCSLRLVVPSRDLLTYMEILHRVCFGEPHARVSTTLASLSRVDAAVIQKSEPPRHEDKMPLLTGQLHRAFSH